MRLFTALWPSPEAVEHLAAAIDGLPPGRVTEVSAGLRKFRFTPAERWHLTLRFHGDDADAARVTERLDRRVARLRADPPRLRLAGAGSFRGVLWVGVLPEAGPDERALRELVGAAGGDPRSFRAHLTVARWAGGRARGESVAALLEGYRGPRWTAEEITVVASDLREGAPRYTAVHRAPVTRG
ncbi:RNA 2',3'-cyclic phosphodiesterase [Saccharopolyspora griseoalba]|uniref:RNA 2',3'-cyclic phosphodiesterase n=1 Tax=Saccharopolyspora griseoalba TaxID=1431848 RepID=A0ABW2LDZ1_9PSEU